MGQLVRLSKFISIYIYIYIFVSYEGKILSALAVMHNVLGPFPERYMLFLQELNLYENFTTSLKTYKKKPKLPVSLYKIIFKLYYVHYNMLIGASEITSL